MTTNFAHPWQLSTIEAAPFDVLRPVGVGEGRGTPAAAANYALVFAFPHSGRTYPRAFIEASRLNAQGLRITEDAFVDDLMGFDEGLNAVQGDFGDVWAIRANYARAFVDVNRHPMELDPRLIKGALPKGALSQTQKVKNGFGVIPRCLTPEAEIYYGPISVAEASLRIDTLHRPYHEQLQALLFEARRATAAQRVALLDWHSMPSSALKTLNALGRGADIVLGDLYGESCRPQLLAAVREGFEREGFKVALNMPFAGGYTTQHYGAPTKGIEALQIEINRSLYMNERAVEVSEGFEGVKARLRRSAGHIMTTLGEYNPSQI
jgi:N-formylglutamate amidohydrolase